MSETNNSNNNNNNNNNNGVSDADTSMADDDVANKTATTTIKDQVRQFLRDEKIQLWNPPFVNERGKSVEQALQDLLHHYCGWNNTNKDPRRLATTTTTTTTTTTREQVEEEEVLQALKEWQSHALTKWKEKKQKNKSPSCNKSSSSSKKVTVVNNIIDDDKVVVTLELKILGDFEVDVNTHHPHDCLFATTTSMEKGITDHEKVSTLVLHNVNLSQTTDVQLYRYLRHVFQTTNVRVIHRGTTILSLGLQGEKDPLVGTALRFLLFPHTTPPPPPPTAAASTTRTTIPLLCLVTRQQNPTDQKHLDSSSSSIQSRINVIRTAALQIRDSTQLEITDQHGVTVPMSAEDRLGFVTALALHRMGVHHPTTLSKTDSLVLLLEADAEWNNHSRLLESWKDRVDNYGLLMLDIAWVHLQLESLDNLQDSLQRLQEAERVLRNQVHVNFVTLALAQAEMGNYKEVSLLNRVCE
jgi:hypothetical protein